jgi:putative transposase
MKDTYTPLEYQRDEHRVHLIVYHLIWCPRRRKPVLTGAIASRCKQIIEEKCQQKGWQILTLAIQPDHVHLFVQCFPSESAALVVKEVKAVTARSLREEFHATLSKLPSMWTGSYFASTAGNVSQQTIQRYIDAQKGI